MAPGLKGRGISRPGWVLAGLALVFLTRAWLYSVAVPFNGQPDELQHMAQVRIAQAWPQVEAGRTDPGRISAELREALESLGLDPPRPPQKGGVMAGYTPLPERRSLYFRLLGCLARLLGLDDPFLAWRAARWFSILAGLAALGLTWLSARLLFPESELIPVLAAGLVGLLPQFGAMSAAVNPDSLAVLLGAAFFCFLAWTARRGLGPLQTGAGLAILLALAGIKKTALFILPVMVLGGLLLFRARTRGGRLFWTAVLILTGVLAGGLVLAAAWPPAARLFVSLFGLPLTRAWGPGFEPLVFRQAGVVELFLQEARLADPGFWLHLKSLVLVFFKSFWGYFGYLEAPLAWWWYALAALLGVLGTAGWLRFDFSGLTAPRVACLALFGLGLLLALAVIFLRQVIFAPGSLAQGRHLFPALVPLAVLWSAGFASLWPRRWAGWPAGAALALVWLMDLRALWGVVVPWFYRVHL